MVSRLDRLFILLDTGSTDAIRLAAAEQLGEVQRLHPNELNLLMQRLHDYSGRQSWETRVATGKAIKAIIKNMPEQEEGEWPLEGICQQYADELFHTSWEIRHGAAIALREIVKIQGHQAGRKLRIGMTTQQNDTLNQLWLRDLSLKVFKAISQDKFGDFLFDQVVAPVRENCAQLLGCCFRYMSEENAINLHDVILKAFDRSEWEVRHGAILSLKYCLSSAEYQLARKLLPTSYEQIRKSLNDPVDDVSAEAASALVPLKEIFIDTMPEKIHDLVDFLWNYLKNLDELSSSTSNIISLLSTLLVSDKEKVDHDKLAKLIPRLWPFISHPSTLVRISVLKALNTLLSSASSSCTQWMPEKLLSDATRLIFQRSLVEEVEEIHELLANVWKLLVTVEGESKPGSLVSQLEELFKATFQYLNYWISLVIYPAYQAIDQSNPFWLNCNFESSHSQSFPSDKSLFIASCTSTVENGEKQRHLINRCRLLASEFLGLLLSNLLDGLYIDENNLDKGQRKDSESDNQKLDQIDILRYINDMFVYYIGTTSATQRIISGWIIDAWYRPNTFSCLGQKTNTVKLPDQLKDRLLKAVDETSLYFDEVISSLTRLQNEAKEFVTFIVNNKLVVNNEMDVIGQARVYTMNQIEDLCNLHIEREISTSSSNLKSVSTKQSSNSKFVEKKRHLREMFDGVTKSQKSLSTAVSCSLSYALVSWQIEPPNMDSIIKPLMDSLSTEDDQLLQTKSVDHLVSVILSLCSNLNNSQVVSSILDNLIKTSCSDTDFEFLSESSITAPSANSEQDHQSRIVYLDNLNKKAEMATRSSTRRQSSIQSVSGLKSPMGSSSNKRSLSVASSIDVDVEFLSDLGSGHKQENDEIFDFKLQQQKMLSTKGASLTLTKLVEDLGKDLPQKLSHLWKMIDDDIKLYRDSNTMTPYELSKRLKVLEIIGPHVHQGLYQSLEDLIPVLNDLLSFRLPLIRHLACRCLGMMVKIMTNTTLDLSLQTILGMLEATECDFKRCGAIEAIGCMIDSLDLGILKLIYLLVVPVLRRMSDKHDQVRLMATHNFGQLVRLMPLDDGKQSDLNEKLLTKRAEEKFFIEQLLDSSKIEDYDVGIPIQAELRSYQQQGINWLAFLNKYNLHGILCDEMGLGKTLMSICMLAGDHNKNMQNTNKDAQDDSRLLPSLVICPPTLTGHWLYEVMKFVPNKQHLNPMVYGGSPSDRIRLRGRISKSQPKKPCHGQPKDLWPVSLVIATYDMVRNDIEFFKSIIWNYCILDEGHVIKNGKTKLSRAIRSITAAHRLILSGTPIQNNVTELWSLFDFLMPGLLGSERQFYMRYARPILLSRDAKCSSRDQEAGALAMESLHGQVLPFILRRKKEYVLKDLPPKIIQDYYCEMSPLQVQLYEDFTTSSLRHELASENGLQGDESKNHVFQALQYLKNVCNHPKLVLKHKHVEFEKIEKKLKATDSSLDDIEHSSKLMALKQLLLDCGIGTPTSSQDIVECALKQHRALIFCQLKSMIDIIEADLLKKHLNNVSFLRLDGSVPSSQRHSIVNRFNNDPSIDVLLLTTQIGGLGLNLTGADTVIFVEHDWNPTKDLQAMDRAHRIGQKKVVNVYRLITVGTLEEKIMGLQKFKTTIANTVISQDNSSLNTMKVDQLFDLFDLDKSLGEEAEKEKETKSKVSVLDVLPELWDQQQYDSEYDLTNFICSLKK